MGFSCVMKLIDAVLFLFFLVIAINCPILNAQLVIPIDFFPKPLVDLKSWYSSEYGDYLFSEKPHFFIGVIWQELLFLWPLSIANLFGLLTGKSWFSTTCLAFGVSCFTSTAAILGELLGSGRASDKLLMAYVPFIFAAALAVLRGLIPSQVTPRKTPLLERKKRA